MRNSVYLSISFFILFLFDHEKVSLIMLLDRTHHDFIVLEAGVRLQPPRGAAVCFPVQLAKTRLLGVVERDAARATSAESRAP